MVGDSDTAVTLDATGTQYALVPHHASLNPAAQITMMAWVKMPTSHDYQTVMMKASTAWGAGYGIFLEGGNICAYVGGAWNNAKACSAFTTGASWRFLAGTYDGSTVRLYIDGVQAATAALAAMPNPGTNDLYIGRSNDGNANYQWWGDLDEVAIFSSALSAANISDIYSAAANGYSCTTTNALVNDSWYHVSGVRASGDNSLKMYVNGSLSCSITTLGALSGSTNAMTVGMDPAGGNAWSGSIGEFRFSTTASAADISNDYQASVSRYSSLPMTDLKLWLKADALTGLNDGDPVAIWEDSSGSGSTAYQNTAAAQPIYKSGALNGLPVVQFDGGNDAMIVTNLGATLSADNTYTIFMVLNHTHATFNYPIILTYPTNGNWEWILEYSNGGSLYWGHTSPNYRLYSVGATANTWAMYSLTRTSATVGTVHKGGDEITGYSTNGTGFVAAPTMTGDIMLGRYWEGSYGFNGQFAEILIYTSTLSDSDRQIVEGYLAHKWGQTGSLPVGHPYKSSPP